MLQHEVVSSMKSSATWCKANGKPDRLCGVRPVQPDRGQCYPAVADMVFHGRLLDSEKARAIIPAWTLPPPGSSRFGYRLVTGEQFLLKL